MIPSYLHEQLLHGLALSALGVFCLVCPLEDSRLTRLWAELQTALFWWLSEKRQDAMEEWSIRAGRRFLRLGGAIAVLTGLSLLWPSVRYLVLIYAHQQGWR